MIDEKTPPHDPHALPLAPPPFLSDHNLKVWRSPAGIWFLYSEAHQTGGMLRTGADGHIWQLYTPCDADQWAGILLGIANDLQAAAEAVAEALMRDMPAANSQAQPT